MVDAPGLRPSSDRVRETLFNWLQMRLPDARILDLFAGSGALGLEALSRGAREAVLVERGPEAAEQLRASVGRLHADAKAHVIRADALSLLLAPMYGRFDIVFIDPPFDSGLTQAALSLLDPWLADNALLYLETALAAPQPDDARLVVHREGRTREVRYALYRRAGGGAATLGANSRPDDAATE